MSQDPQGDLTVGHFPYSPGFNPYQRLFSESLESAGLRVVRIPNRKILPIHFALSHPIDLLHMDWPHSFYIGRNWLATRIKRAMYALGLSRLKRFPLVWTAHNLAAHDAADDRTMIQRLIDRCDGIVVMSTAAERLLRETYRVSEATRVAVIPHGHYIDAYPNDITPASARAELNIAPAARVVLLLGRIRPYKGADLLIRVFRQVARDGDVLLLAGPVGSGRLSRELSDLAASPGRGEVRFDGQLVPADRLQVYFNACDLVALPFRRILHSGSLLLAMSFGRCVVAPRIGSIEEIACPHAYFGYDADDLPSALSAALDRDDLLAAGRDAMAFARQHYGWPDVGRKARALYEQILSGRTKHG